VAPRVDRNLRVNFGLVGSPATVTTRMELSAASGSGVAGLHMLTDLAFGTSISSTLWAAGVSYPLASVEL
jgi:hypothetical protein